MHTVIRTIVIAKTKKGALEAARCTFEDLCGEGKSFDYVTYFRRGYTHEQRHQRMALH